MPEVCLDAHVQAWHKLPASVPVRLSPRQYLLLPLSLFQGAAQGLFKPLTVVGTNQDDGCKVKMKVAQCVQLLSTPRAIQSMEFSRPEYWSEQPFPSSGDLSNPGIEPRSALQADSLPAEPQGKPRNTGVGSLSLLQRIFPTQELNCGLLHCRHILYQLSHQGSQKGPAKIKSVTKCKMVL